MTGIIRHRFPVGQGSNRFERQPSLWHRCQEGLPPARNGLPSTAVVTGRNSFLPARGAYPVTQGGRILPGSLSPPRDPRGACVAELMGQFATQLSRLRQDFPADGFLQGQRHFLILERTEPHRPASRSRPPAVWDTSAPRPGDTFAGADPPHPDVSKTTAASYTPKAQKPQKPPGSPPARKLAK